MALQWVECLLEPGISEEKLVESSQHLGQAQYSDVVEERSIEHLCGYPLCSNELGDVPAQLYHVSAKHNQVFDLTMRKKFCGNACFKKSGYFSSQLYSLPLRARVGSRQLDVKLLSDEGAPVKVHSRPANKKPADKKPTDKKPVKRDSVKVNPYQTKPVVVDLVVREKQAVKKPEPLLECTEVVPRQLSSVGKLLHAMTQWSTPDKIMAPATMEGTGGDLHSTATNQTVFLPPVDTLTQRRHIFQQGLRKHLPYVSSQLGLAAHQVSTQLANITATFKLDRYTVTFRVAEWKVIVAVLLIVISPDLKRTHQSNIEEWLKDISASENDLELMLKTFTKYI